MKNFQLLVKLTIATFAIACGTAFSQPAADGTSPRNVISLDGEWQIAAGDFAEPPAAFESTIPVPGLVDMAQPPVPQFDEETSTPKAYWYHRTFKLEGPVPAVAILKLHKAAYGSQVVLNGQKFEERWSSFTPLFSDVKSALHEGENDLIIRVGGHARLMPSGNTHGLDPEKTKYIAGLFDSVELILTGSPQITNIQTVPDINAKQVQVQALLKNETGAARESRVKFTVREHKSGRIVGSAESPVSLPPGDEETTVTVSVAIDDCHLWSPEDPFLYDVVADCDTDQVTQRFGMRSFRLDQATGRAMLNGHPYFLRGSNITLYRFFEDSERDNLPWDRDWVRGLHRTVRGMHWNSLRYCIGFPPDFWYDIADEEGILIQDEFPIWNARHGNIPNDNNPGILIREFTSWMRERWNHPCVVIWDAENETHSEVTGQVIAAVRDLDLSNRPWDNGYGRYRIAGDSFESHPYLYNKPGFTVEDLASRSGTPLGNHGGPNVNDNPYILNEYGWLWLNRDGSPTKLSRPIYARLLKGQNATPEEYRHLYARLLAELTEFWRSHRACAGVLHFCVLGYSRPPDGQTSDHFIDVKNLKLDPEFTNYVRDAFAPVGVMLDFFERRMNPGAKLELGVAIINDLDVEWRGEVHLNLLRNGKVVDTGVQNCIVPAYGCNELLFPITLPKSKGDYQFHASIDGEHKETVSSWRDFQIAPLSSVEGHTSAGLAAGMPATASSSYASELSPSMAFDGDSETRWAAKASDPAWLMVDLMASRPVSAVELQWENAFAKEYTIDVSTDGKKWHSVYKTTKGYGDEPIIRFQATDARYVRLNATQRGTQWGISLYEMKVF